jgi:hypothetical protein
MLAGTTQEFTLQRNEINLENIYPETEEVKVALIVHF